MEIEVAAGGGSRATSSDSCNGSFRDIEKGWRLKGGEAYLVWEDLTVMLPNFGQGPTRKLLDGLNGYAEPGRIMAVIGPSGSGKTTLLDALAGRLSRNIVMTGNILLNGQKRRMDYGVVAYVTQKDILLGTLTVRETLTYNAYLRLPSSATKREIKAIVEETITDMGLQECADRRIGNWLVRGISGGEKRRLSIALEILIRPPILFLDEPTSGIDSAAAFFVIKAIKNIARGGRTVISVVHQPSSEVFALFDDLCLLSGGEAVYFGEAKTAVKFFGEAGFPCPSRRNPSDHFMRCINTDFDTVTAILRESNKLRGISDPLMNLKAAHIKSLLVDKYKHSEYAKNVKLRIQEISVFQGLEIVPIKGSQASWWKQLSTLTQRSFVNMYRDVGYYWARVVIYAIVALCLGTIFYDVGTGYNSIWARGACGGFVTGFMTFMSIGGFPSFIEDLKVFYRERLNGYYGVAVFIFSNFFSSLPFLVAVSGISGTITFYMVKFRSEFSHYVYFCLNMFGCIAVVESVMMIIASLVPNFLMGIISGAGVLGVMMMTAGFFVRLADLPKPIWRYPVSYLGYGSWSLQGAIKNDIIGLEFDPLIPGDPKIKGEDVITKTFRISVDHSKWWDLFAVYSLIVCYRLLFFVILKVKEKTAPFFQSLYTKRVIHRFKKRQSLMRKSPYSSRRHDNPHPLSIQEGLNSPIS